MRSHADRALGVLLFVSGVAAATLLLDGGLLLLRVAQAAVAL